MNARRGILMFELAVAAALAGVLLTVGLQMLFTTVARQRLAEERSFALVELGNVMERVAARPWSELAALTGERVSPATAKALPGAEMKIEVVPSEGTPDGKRITASLGWQDRNGQRTQPLRLTTWRFRTARNESQRVESDD